jgi:eukaryotic-like serine/threonine-protein kinase
MPICSTCGTRYGSTVRICIRDGTPLVAGRTDDPNLGKLLDGKYRIDAFISGGGMGSVYRATHVMLGKAVAVKVIRSELVTSDDVVRRFQREARAAAALDHPNIVTVHDLGQAEDGTLYIAMELIDGPSLKEAIRRDGPMPAARAVDILRQVAGALAVAHQNHIIHRDLKSQNLMLASDSSGAVTAKLVDFGIAKTFDEPAVQLTEAGFVLGTPHYMSPEQAAGKVVDHRADIYSLGVILYEMLVGDVPFGDAATTSILVKLMTEVPDPPSRRRTDVDVPPGLEAIAMRCLEKDPGKRFQSASEFAAALERTQSEIGLHGGGVAERTFPAVAHPTLVRPPVMAPPIPATTGRSWVLAAVLVAAIPLVGAFAFGPAVSESREVPSPRRVDVTLPSERLALPVPHVETKVSATSVVTPRAVVEPQRPPAPRQAVQLPVPLPPSPQAAAPPRPEHPPVFVQCDGPAQLCSAVRAEIVSALRRNNLPLAVSPEQAEVELTAVVGILGQTVAADFGTHMVTTTYSVDLLAESHGAEVAMPPAHTFSFDARFGSARLPEQARLVAAGAVEGVREFWRQTAR